jgi:hypothetical protein
MFSDAIFGYIFFRPNKWHKKSLQKFAEGLINQALQKDFLCRIVRFTQVLVVKSLQFIVYFLPVPKPLLQPHLLLF